MAAGILFPSVLTHAPGRLLFAASTRKPGVSLAPLVLAADLRTGGRYMVRGTTKVAGTPDVPVARRVRLYHFNQAGFMAKEVWSEADGSYEFRNVDRGPWFVVSHDHTGEYNAVIADNVLGDPI